MNTIAIASSIDEEYHCAIPLTSRANDELDMHMHDNLPQSEIPGGCRGTFVQFQRATILALVSHILMYREGYHLCSRFDSYLGRCRRGRGGGGQGYP